MKYRIDPNKVVWRNLDGEVIILDIDSGHYYGLNKTGSLIWNLFAQDKTLQEAIEKLSDQFKISKKAALEDTSELIATLQKEGLLLKEKA